MPPLPNTTATLIPLSWAPVGPARPTYPSRRVQAAQIATPPIQPILTAQQSGWQVRGPVRPTYPAGARLPRGETLAPPPLADIANAIGLIRATSITVTQPTALAVAITQPTGLTPAATQQTALALEVQ